MSQGELFPMSKCRACGADIVWIETPNGKRMPCDPPRRTIVDDMGQVREGRTPHWATCPNAEQFRRGPQP